MSSLLSMYHFDSCYSLSLCIGLCTAFNFLHSIKKKVTLKFQILLQLSDFSDDSYYTKAEESFFTRKMREKSRISAILLLILN